MPQQACTLSTCTPATVRRPLSVVPLLLLLLFLCCASVCVAWDDGSVQSAGVVRELPRTGQSGVQAYTFATREQNGGEDKDWKLIRIVASTEDLKAWEVLSKNCTEEKNRVSEDHIDKKCHWKRESAEERKNLMETIIPAAIKLHEDRLLVRRGSEMLRVPEFDYDGTCNSFIVPKEHRNKGVNADFVLYVVPMKGLKFGVTCAWEGSTGRPIVGVMSYVPDLQGGLRLNVRRAAHEIAHALGFNMHEMGNKSKFSAVDTDDSNRVKVKSAKTVERAQKHYNCPGLEGVELQLDESNEVIPHWLLRVAKDELMADPDYGGAGYYTALTMALFEDLRYYKANWGMAEPMSWGNQSGCPFLKEKCTKGDMINNIYCLNTISRCTSDRTSYGTCLLGTDIHKQYQDTCEVNGSYYIERERSVNTSYCTDTSKALPGSLMGPDSWCLDGEGLQLKNGNSEHTGKGFGGVCARVLCDDGSRTVKVQYKGDENNWHDCSEGSSIVVKSSAFTSGKIKCPKYDEVCTIASNGSSRVLLGVKQPAAPGGSTSSGSKPAGSTSSGETSVRKDQGNKGVHSNSETDRNGSAAQEPKTPSATGSRNRRDTAVVNPSRTSDNTQIGGAAATASPSGKDKANTNAPLQYPEGVTQAHIDLLQNGTALGSQFGKDGAFSAVSSLPIVFLLMVLAVVLPC